MFDYGSKWLTFFVVSLIKIFIFGVKDYVTSLSY